MVLVQKMKELPKVGDKIPVEKFHVSPCNVRADEPFGEAEEDKKLIANIRATNKIIQPFKAKLESEGYGVYAGKRRFEAAIEAGVFSEFLVGEHCLIKNVSDEEAEEESWTENFREFHKEMNPITRAKGLNRFVSRWGVRGYARRSGIPASSISEYLKVLELSPRMQGVLAKKLLGFKDGLTIARMNLDKELQDKLAEVLETQGTAAFKKLIRRKDLMRRASAKKLAKEQKQKVRRVVAGRTFWKELTWSLKEFANYWCDYSELREWEDIYSYHLNLDVTMSKDLNESYDPNGLESLDAEEAPQICGPCGKDILEGDSFAEKEGIYYCAKCAPKELSH